MNTKDKSSYRQIVKATSIFGGVQVLNIIISIIRSKFVAVLLGPSGMGVAGLLSSMIGLISASTTFGLGTSAVKDIAVAYQSKDDEKIIRIISVFKKLVWLTGTLGAIICLVLSSYLSEIVFGNANYTYPIIYLSITLLLGSLTTGQMVILQGFRKLKILAKASIVGSVLGLLTSIPLYYYFGERGIVPGMIVSSFLGYFISIYFSKQIKVSYVKLPLKEVFNQGNEMLKMGFVLSLNTLFLSGTSFAVRAFISNKGGVEDVGLYNAGFALIGTYVAMVFTAMSTDYYPRLSSITNNNQKSAKLINQQAEICILVLSPILCVFFIFSDFILTILYSNKFVAVNVMIHWAALGMYFKAISWSIGFIFMAKGDSKMFLVNEFSSNIYLLIINILGYHYFGLTGIGFSFFIGYVIYFFQIYYVSKKKYSFFLDIAFLKTFGIQFLIGIACFLIINIFNNNLNYFIGSFLILLSSAHALVELDKRIDFKNILIKFKK